ncbi:MAG: phosphoribosylaminoimidazolesuccinocarboxamide synthase [Neisseriaceae bacterium]|nr:phosphoribosylaminoimidazolesuccinocarboxamide synthase [Neisseriaceae bacterium]
MSSLTSLKKIYSGKVRDLYEIDSQRLLMVASDRLSAFDVILNEPIPNKGKILTSIANFWFDHLAHIMPNHLTGENPKDFVSSAEWPSIQGRAVVAKKLKPLPIEAIVRGYLAGSGWSTYQASNQICGISLPFGLQNGSRLEKPLFTPSTKAAVGDHDENISYEQCVALLGVKLAAQVQQVSIQLYETARDYALSKGIIIADTKFEFGLDEMGNLVLMDEVLTPDSSRFWPISDYKVGHNPPSFDKQIIRDWLTASGWDKCSPAPSIPLEICKKTADKYQEVLDLLTSK